MIFNHKLFWLLLPCSLTSLSTISFSSTESSNPIQSKAKDSETIDLKEELGFLSKIGSSTNFLEFGTGSNKTLEALIKEYLKTSTGAKVLSKRLTQHLIINLIESYSQAGQSATKDKLQSKLRTLRSTENFSNLSSKEQEEARFLFAGNTDEYNKNQTLEKARDIFEPVLNEILNNLSFDESKHSFKRESDADPFIKLLSEFWDHVLDDYIKYERPVPIKKLTWKYDKQKRTQDIKDLFDNPKESLPEDASYYFPFISVESEKRFKGFLEKIKETQETSKLKEYSDDSNIDLIVPITSLSEGTNTSQFSIATLELYHYLITRITREKFDDQKSFLREADLVTSSFDCNHKTTGIPEVSIENLTKDTKDLFCLRKDKGNNGTNNAVSDFLYLISKQQQQQQSSWILFKDKDGIHAITYDKSVFDKSYEKEKFKKSLVNAKNFNLKDKLNKHLNKHFERLVLGHWDKFFPKKDQQDQQDQAKELQTFLIRDHFSKNLVDLRKALLKDYLQTFSSTLSKKDGSFEKGLKSAFVGKFPYEFFPSNKKQNLPSIFFNNFNNKMIPYLEQSYLLELSRLSKYPWALDDLLDVKASFNKYEGTIEKLFSGKSGKQEDWKNFKFFKFSDGAETVNSKPEEVKKIENGKLLSSVWISLLKDQKLSEILFKEKIKSGIKFSLDFSEWKWNLEKEIDGIKDVSFANSSNSKNLIFSYLHQYYLELVKGLNIPQILGDFDFEKENNKLQELFEKVNKEFKVTLSSDGFDVSNGGTLLELLTIQWLSKDKFDNFRKHLRNTLRRDTLTAFVFSKKFSESEKCLANTRDKTKIFENLELKKSGQKSDFIFRQTSNSDSKLACPVNEDSVNFATATINIEQSKQEEKQLTGYRGLINGGWKDHFPADIANKLEYAFPLWKDSNSLINYIDESINSEDKYEELIKILKSLFPNYSWDFEGTKCGELVFNWRTGIRGSSCFEKSDSSFKDKKEQLKQYLEKGYKSDKNSSRTSLVGGRQLLDEKLFDSKNDWFTDKDGNYLISSSDGNEYQIYLIQIKYDDVKDQSNWTAFLKTINSSPFFRELVKVAKDPKVQKQALLSELNSGTGSLKSFKTGDDRLKRILGYSWLNLKN